MTDRHLISIRDLSNDGMLALFALADEFAAQPRRRLDLGRDAVMVTLFFEPSTRTRLSFEAAMLRLGGQVLTMADPNASSAAKGETLADTVRIVTSYADLIVLRHPREGAARVAAEFSGVPVINAGDGAREHPTQTLLDLYTIRRETGRLAGLRVALCGDLKHGRTVHSLVQGLARFGVQMIGVSPRGLELPEHFRAHLRAHYGVEVAHYPSLDAAPLEACDVLYVTRLQKERFADAEAFQRVRSSYQVSRQTLERARPDAIVLHPLPRVDELDCSLDGDPRAAYFRQAAYGVPVRMALIAALLGWRDVPGFTAAPADGAACRCANPRCITAVEPAVTPRLLRRDDAACCAYCETFQEAPCPAF